jgi:hypothetical protein
VRRYALHFVEGALSILSIAAKGKLTPVVGTDFYRCGPPQSFSRSSFPALRLFGKSRWYDRGFAVEGESPGDTIGSENSFSHHLQGCRGNRFDDLNQFQFTLLLEKTGRQPEYTIIVFCQACCVEKCCRRGHGRFFPVLWRSGERSQFLRESINFVSSPRVEPVRIVYFGVTIREKRYLW